jgi:hypothetical protein
MNNTQQDSDAAAMASSMTAAAKQQLRSIMKQKLSELSPDMVGAQSKLYLLRHATVYR